MKRYDYVCPKCGRRWESDSQTKSTCECGVLGRRLYTVNVNFHPTKGKR